MVTSPLFEVKFKNININLLTGVGDWRFFVFCGNLFLRLGQIGFSCGELISAILRKCPVASIDNIFVFIVRAIEIHIFKH